MVVFNIDLLLKNATEINVLLMGIWNGNKVKMTICTMEGVRILTYRAVHSPQL